MNCQEFCEQLDAALDERRMVSRQTGSAGETSAPNAEIIAHAESCPDCQLLYEEHVLIETALAAWMPLRTAFDLTDRVIEAAREEGLISSNSSSMPDAGPAIEVLDSDRSAAVAPENVSELPARRNIWATVVTVALVLAAVTLVFRERSGNVVKQDKTPLPFSPNSQPEQLNEPQDQLADIGHLVADAQSAWQGITSRVSHQASGFSVFVPNLTDDLGISDVTGSLETAPEATDPNDRSEPAEPMEPSAVEKAFEFLFDDEPGSTQTI